MIDHTNSHAYGFRYSKNMRMSRDPSSRQAEGSYDTVEDSKIVIRKLPRFCFFPSGGLLTNERTISEKGFFSVYEGRASIFRAPKDSELKNLIEQS